MRYLQGGTLVEGSNPSGILIFYKAYDEERRSYVITYLVGLVIGYMIVSRLLNPRRKT